MCCVLGGEMEECHNLGVIWRTCFVLEGEMEYMSCFGGWFGGDLENVPCFRG